MAKELARFLNKLRHQILNFIERLLAFSNKYFCTVSKTWCFSLFMLAFSIYLSQSIIQEKTPWYIIPAFVIIGIMKLFEVIVWLSCFGFVDTNELRAISFVINTIISFIFICLIKFWISPILSILTHIWPWLIVGGFLIWFLRSKEFKKFCKSFKEEFKKEE